MTDEETMAIDMFTYVHVQASDYDYVGWIVCAGRKKRSGKVRVVVEDGCGRWFVHNPGQLRVVPGYGKEHPHEC